MNCRICKENIVDFDFICEKFQTPPTMCENCRRRKRSYRKSSDKIKREIIFEAKQKIFSDFNMKFEKEPTKRNKSFIFSVRNKGKRVLIYASRSIVGTDAKKPYIKPVCVDIRLMKKQVGDETNLYLVIEKSKSSYANESIDFEYFNNKK